MLANEARSCGWLLVAGFVVFLLGAVFWRYAFQGPILAETLRSVGAENSRWLWIHAWIAAGSVLTAVGLSQWVEIQRAAGERLRTPAAVTLYVLGVALWLVGIGIRVTIQTWAADEVLAGRGVPAMYAAIHRLAGVLYAAFMILSYVASAVLGLGILRSGVLSASTGFVGLVGGALFTLGFIVVRGGPFAPPIMALLYTLWLGVALLRKGG
jgi:hypothetical protein